MSGKHIVGLDIGTTKVCVVVASQHPEGTEVLGLGLAPSQGMRKGVVVDMDAVTSSIRDAVSRAEEASGINIRRAYVGVSGSHMGCMRSYGTTGIRGKEVTEQDVENVLESAGTVLIPLEQEVLHVMPMDYVLDGQDGIVRPVGMSGVRLEANVTLVTASHACVDNVTKCCERAGIAVTDVVYEAVASAKAVLRPYELESGVAVLDLGGGSTDLAVFKQGGLCHAASLPVGGNHFTSDIAIGLKVSRQEAERIKRAYGYAVGFEAGPVEMDATSMDGRPRKMRRSLLGEIILPRCEEIFELLHDEIKEALMMSEASCVVLTGGTALLEGIDRVAEARLGIPVRIGEPTGMEDAEAGPSPVFATGMGLALYGAESEWNEYDDFVEGMRARFKSLRRMLTQPVGLGFRKSRPDYGI